MRGNADSFFVYGSLTHATLVDALLEDWGFDGDAVLEGLHRVDGRHPTLAPGGETEGRLLVTDDLGRIDAYEGVDVGLYVRVAVPLDTGGEAWLYVGDPARLGAPADWPGEGPFGTRVRAYLESASVGIWRAGNR